MMRYLKGTIVALGAGLVLSASSATADEWNHKTILTINEPMVVPGATLEPGTYEFTLADENGSRNFVNIFRESDHQLVTTAKVIRMHRTTPSDLKLTVAMPEGSVPVMKGWIYPGTEGHEFIYPKDQARAMANAETVDIPVSPRG